MNPNEKIQLDDISFDDVIGGDGVNVTSTEAPNNSELDDLRIDEEEEIEEESTNPNDYEVEDQDEYEEDEEEDEEEEENYNNENTNEETGERSVISEVLDELGYDLEGAAYEDTSKGIAQMTQDLASQLADDRIDEVLEAFPLVKKHLDYVLAGGNSQQFMEAYDPNLDYNNVKLEEDDYRAQKAILGDYLHLKGHDTEFINEMLNDFEDTGKLYQKSEAARAALAKNQNAQRERMVTQQRQQQAELQETQQKFWGNISDTLDESNSFAGISIPNKEKNKFFDYLSTPVTKEGHTQRDLDHSQANLDVKLAIDYLMYTGFDLSQLIDSKAKTQNAKTLRERISANEDKVKSTRRSTRQSKTVDYDNLDLNI